MQMHPMWSGHPASGQAVGWIIQEFFPVSLFYFGKVSRLVVTVCEKPGEGASQVQVTWGDEESPPQLLVPRHIPDLLRHVDHPAGHGGDPAEVQDPGGKVTGKGSNLCTLARSRLAWNEYLSLCVLRWGPPPPGFWELTPEPGL